MRVRKRDGDNVFLSLPTLRSFAILRRLLKRRSGPFTLSKIMDLTEGPDKLLRREQPNLRQKWGSKNPFEVSGRTPPVDLDAPALRRVYGGSMRHLGYPSEDLSEGSVCENYRLAAALAANGLVDLRS